MDDTMPILLVPGLVSSPRIFAPVLPATPTPAASHGAAIDRARNDGSE